MAILRDWKLYTVFAIGILSVRYFVLSSITYFGLWKWGKHRFQKQKIQKNGIRKHDLKREISYSLSTVVILMLSTSGLGLMRKYGWGHFYDHVSERGWPYLLFSIVCALLVHDTYFYWTHRWMHRKGIYERVHRVHHQSTNPTPYASFAFHPLEALVQGGVVYLFPLLMPVHFITIVAFTNISFIMNILGHSGYEIFPQGFLKSFFGRFMQTSTHHNLHHEKFRGNYSIYFTHWDRWMGTQHPDTVARFLEHAQ